MQHGFLKKIYSHREGYVALYKGLHTLPHLVKNARKKLLSRQFIERIMLAVTEVNGCEVCAYGHTKMALEHGMSHEEIGRILSGDTSSIDEDELVAVMFAQHYADTRGNPSAGSWERVIDHYEKEKALVILSATRMIMIGNIFGIPLSALLRRLKRKKVLKTNPFYEITMLLGLLILGPVAAVHAFVLILLRVPGMACQDGP